MGRSLAEHFRDRPAAAWVDGLDFAARILRGGRPLPWLEPTELVHFLGEADRLVPSAVSALPLAPVYRAWIDAHPELRDAMAAKKRSGFALKTLLAEEGPRRLLKEILTARSYSTADLPQILVLPAPERWAEDMHALVHGETPPPADADGAETAAMYLADALRDIIVDATSGILIEAPAFGAETYRPILNLAAHYRLAVGLVAEQAAEGFDFHVAPASGFWSGAATPGGFYAVTVPADAVPETVRERLKQN